MSDQLRLKTYHTAMSNVIQMCYNNSHLKGVSLRALNTRDVSNHTNLKGDAMNNDTSEMVLIPLTQGQVAIVSPEDADLADLKWQAQFLKSYTGGGKFIAKRNTKLNGKDITTLMHRVILSRMLGRPLLRLDRCDHIHGLTLDNRRSEIRLATPSQNQWNKGRYANNTSGYKGVSWNKEMKKWAANISAYGKNKRLGFYDDPVDAYKAYCEAALKYHGEFANVGDVA